MSQPIILEECQVPNEMASTIALAKPSAPMLLIHVDTAGVVCEYCNVGIGPLIGILDALKDRLLEQQKNGTPQS